MKVLVIEDDQLISANLFTVLTADRYVVDLAKDGKIGLEMALEWDYDLIVTDLMLPTLDGISLCYQLRSQGYQKPILLLTAKDKGHEIVAGLDAGADDYVIKPYDANVLLARIRALLRRRERAIAEPLLVWENLQLNPTSAEVTYMQQPIFLSPKEYSLLELFLRHPQRIFSRNAIIDQLWTTLDAPTENAVTNLIKDVRRKLKAAGLEEDPFDTVYGLGYRLRASPNHPAPVTLKSNGKIPVAPDLNPASSILPDEKSTQPGAAAVYQVLERFQDSFQVQIQTLEAAIELLQTDRLTVKLQQQLQQEAHKLVGSLGTFGYMAASAIAYKVEQLLLQPDLTDEATRSIRIAQFNQYLAALKFELTQPPQLAPDAIASSFTTSTELLVVSDALDLIADLTTAAISHPVGKIRSVTKAVITELSLDFLPTVVLVDIDDKPLTRSELALLQALARRFVNVPIWILIASNNLEDRVMIAQTGVQGILQKPLTASQILGAIAQNQPRSLSLNSNILIVDDDAATLAALETILTGQGWQITSLTQPQKFWQTLTQAQPDLLLLDLEMPTFSGIELCQVVRRAPQWAKVPILVVTAHIDAASIQKVFAAGADDFIRKPIIETELTARVRSWLARSRLQPAK
jgi:DNA-binding response OmpR family regulator/HPt (histidine-containing phosphotransfer) domain-containing protein